MLDDPRGGLPSASKLERIAACPGSHLLEQDPRADSIADPENDVEIRDVGVRVHKARETSNTLELNAEEHDLYQSGLRYEQRLLEKWKSTWSFKDGEVIEGPREFRLWIHNHNLDPVGSGQLDVHFICREYAHIIDWKAGFLNHLVGATGNYQLRMQAVLLWLEHPHLKNIRVAFAKPRYEDSQLDYCDYSEMDLKYSYESIVLALWWATQPDATRSPGQHCRYCRAKTFCPQALAFALLPTTILQLADKNVNWKKPEESVPLVSNEDLYRLWDAGSVIRNILDAISARLKSMPDSQLAEIGLKHGKGRQLMEWTDTRAAFEYLVREKHWDEKALWNALEFGLGKLAKVAEKETGIDEKYSKDEVKKILAEFIAFKEGEPMLRKLK